MEEDIAQAIVLLTLEDINRDTEKVISQLASNDPNSLMRKRSFIEKVKEATGRINSKINSIHHHIDQHKSIQKDWPETENNSYFINDDIDQQHQTKFINHSTGNNMPMSSNPFYEPSELNLADAAKGSLKHLTHKNEEESISFITRQQKYVDNAEDDEIGFISLHDGKTFSYNTPPSNFKNQDTIFGDIKTDETLHKDVEEGLIDKGSHLNEEEGQSIKK